MKIEFYLRFKTTVGQALFVSGNYPEINEKGLGSLYPLSYLNNDFWHASLELEEPEDTLNYRYSFQNEYGEITREAEQSRYINFAQAPDTIVVIDSWNDESFFENAFYTAPFNAVYFKNEKKLKQKKGGQFTHLFKVKAPLLQPSEAVCLVGSIANLGAWDRTSPVVLQKKDDWWVGEVNIDDNLPHISYKYGVVNLATKAFVGYESGDNRGLFLTGGPSSQTIVHDAFLRVPNTTWKGAGVAVPVFSFRSAGSFGIGEFSDIKCLVDWAREVGLKLIQLLPVNDTSATGTWRDSYPYAAISAFALHPAYINLTKVAGKKYAAVIKSIAKKQRSLNALPQVDYDQVMAFKLSILRELYEMDEGDFLQQASYKEFFAGNRFWLLPYAAFCFYRDKFGTPDFSQWKTSGVYNEEEVLRLASPKNKSFKHLAFFYFVQYHLHLQLKEAVDYAHKKGVAIKGDIPIGIYRYGADAWMEPQLYNMDMQAGAPPDDFAVKGQNWGFPTYNWQKMEQDHFEWWRRRFHQMSNYFDAFRIDHILGFFRIWSVPMTAVEGILGRFIPAVPIAASEFGEWGLWFDHHRYCQPFIVDSIVEQIFGELADHVKQTFLQPNNRQGYNLQEPFDNQRKVELYFSKLEPSTENERLKQGLFDLLSNVILLEEEGGAGDQFHFRIAVENTTSFQYLDDGTRHKLRELYINYFYRRQDGFWKAEAMKKLPALKDATNMLVCGEDLGMVPDSVPGVMKALGILSLEVQRMPKDPTVEFFHPATAPYLSVVTPSTHDMSTIRGWWEENPQRTQRFFNNILGEAGQAPFFCEAWINRAIVLQHLYAPAMWSIFQLQDLLGMSEDLRRQNPAEERINDPANANYYWNYRMHLTLEQLIKETAFNNELKDYIKNSGRG